LEDADEDEELTIAAAAAAACTAPKLKYKDPTVGDVRKFLLPSRSSFLEMFPAWPFVLPPLPHILPGSVAANPAVDIPGYRLGGKPKAGPTKCLGKNPEGEPPA
jgi:hypothetical protein